MTRALVSCDVCGESGVTEVSLAVSGIEQPYEEALRLKMVELALALNGWEVDYGTSRAVCPPCDDREYRKALGEPEWEVFF